MKYLLIFFIVLISGCATMDAEDEPVLPEATKTVDIPDKYFEACKNLQELTTPTFEGLLTTHKENVIVYNDCKTKHDASIELLKEFSNKWKK